MVLEFLFGYLVLLLEAAELQRVMLARGTYVVGDDVVMGDKMALVCVVPEPAYVLDGLAFMVYQDVVYGDDAPAGGIAGGRVLLKLLEAALIEVLHIPVYLYKPAIEARLVGGVSELAIDTPYALSRGYHKAGEVFSQMLPFRSVGEEVAVSLQSLFYYRGKLNDGCHGTLILNLVMTYLYSLILLWSTQAILQNFRLNILPGSALSRAIASSARSHYG